MKLELFYVVRPYTGGTDRIGRSSDCELITGPFKSWNSAFEAKKDLTFSDRYEVVGQTVEVTQ